MSKEIMLASEAVNRNNILAGIEHGNQTRKIVRDLENKVKKIETLHFQIKDELKELRTLMINIQAKLYVGGTT